MIDYSPQPLRYGKEFILKRLNEVSSKYDINAADVIALYNNRDDFYMLSIIFEHIEHYNPQVQKKPVIKEIKKIPKFFGDS